MKRVKELNALFLVTIFVYNMGSVLIAQTGIADGNYALALIMIQVFLALPALVYALISKISLKDLLRFNKIKIGTVFLLILFAFLISPVMQFINLITMMFVKNDIGDTISVIADNEPFIVSLFAIAMVPAFLEESVYRGCFFNTYSKVSPMKAVFLSALYFGLMHGNFNQFSYAFIMGMIFCLIVEGTDSLFSSMIIHFVINGSSVVLLYLLPLLEKLLLKYSGRSASTQIFADDVNAISHEQLLISIGVYGVMAVFGAVLSTLVFIAIVKHEGRWEHVKSMFSLKSKTDVQSPYGDSKKFGSWTMYAGIFILLVSMIANEFI